MYKPSDHHEKAFNQSGMALISALLVIILITSLLSTLYSNQVYKIQHVSNATTITQSKWLLHALTDGIRYLLRDDYIKGKPIDHLGEIWALPVSDSSLDILLKKNQLADTSLNTKNIFISYKIDDAQGRFNLANLAGHDAQSNAKAIKSKVVFKLFLTKIGADQRVEKVLLDKLKELNQNIDKNTGKSIGFNITEADLLHDLDATDAKILEKFVSLLPEQTLININTVENNLLTAVLPDISPVTLQKLIERRQKTPFTSSNDLKEFIAVEQPTLKFSDDLIGVRSSFFRVYAAIRHENAVISQSMLISRKTGRSPVTEILRLEKEDFKTY